VRRLNEFLELHSNFIDSTKAQPLDILLGRGLAVLQLTGVVNKRPLGVYEVNPLQFEVPPLVALPTTTENLPTAPNTTRVRAISKLPLPTPL